MDGWRLLEVLGCQVVCVGLGQGGGGGSDTVYLLVSEEDHWIIPSLLCSCVSRNSSPRRATRTGHR